MMHQKCGAGDMVDELPPTGPIDLDALDDYLMSDLAPDESMGLSDLDGFLTGIVVGPELILPSEWLPVIWGGEEPEFQTEAEMRTVLGTIMAATIRSSPASLRTRTTSSRSSWMGKKAK
jgi:hypothetical protein